MTPRYVFLAAAITAVSAVACGGGTAATPPDRPVADATPPRPESPPAEGDARIGTWGFAVDDMLPDVAPGDDFFRYANGKWLDTFTIPDDFSNYGAFTVLFEEAETQLRAIVEDLQAGKSVDGAGPDRQRVADHYKSFVDVTAIEGLGLTPIAEDMATLAALSDHAAVARTMADPVLGTRPVSFYVDLDPKNTDRYIVHFVQSGLGLPDRDYYLEEKFAEKKQAYRAYIVEVFKLAEITDPEPKADAIMALETQLAEAHWPRAKKRDRDLTYNLTPLTEVSRVAPGFPWPLFAEASGFASERDVNLREKDGIVRMAKEFTATPVKTWRAYLQLHYLRRFADVLPKAIDDANFALYGRTLSGQPEQRARWKRGIESLNRALGDALGRIYVARHFSPEAKQQMLVLVENVKRAFLERLEGLDWMGEATKAEARAKLKAFRAKIAYPDTWEDYRDLTIVAGDALGNAKRSLVWHRRDDIGKLGGPVDRDEWFMNPQTVNAYYSGTRNEIVFPAAILQPPFFDPKADLAVNYGGIGAVIGHEIGHGFDDQGRKSDGRGLLRDWWTEEDKARFQERADRLGAQYATYEPIEGMPLDPNLTMGENIGDLGGLTLAFHAYKLALNGEEPPARDGFTGDQRFFLAWAQVWKRKYREEELRRRIVTDPHSPSEFRTNGIVRNLDAWYAAFGVSPDAKLYLSPEDRVSIW
ncbi:MAG: M13 family metallopeptidase [Myxococcota bacterium]